MKKSPLLYENNVGIKGNPVLKLSACSNLPLSDSWFQVVAACSVVLRGNARALVSIYATVNLQPKLYARKRGCT